MGIVKCFFYEIKKKFPWLDYLITYILFLSIINESSMMKMVSHNCIQLINSLQ